MMPANRRRDGFSLAEIIIAVALVAILVGALSPLVFRQLDGAKEEATTAELAALRQGLLDFYRDTGRFPSEAEGLIALAENPGVTGWQGPYVGGKSAQDDEILQDAFENTYRYDLGPATNPSGAADAIVASAGRNGVLEAGSVGGLWTPGGAGDDHLALVASGPQDRRNILACGEAMRRIGEAAGRYYQDHASFPSSNADLLGSYLPDDPRLFQDPWFQTVTMTVQYNGNLPPVLTLMSRGPDQVDSGGAGDDVDLVVSAIPPGRQVTMQRLATAQQAMTADPLLALAGDWPGSDRPALQLPGDLDVDGWGRPFQVDSQARIVFSMGPDGLAETIQDNIPGGTGFGALPPGGGGQGEDEGGDEGNDGWGGDDGNDGDNDGWNDGDNDDGNNGGGNGGGNGDGNNGGGNGHDDDDDDDDDDDEDDEDDGGHGGGRGRG